jgi:integrase
MARKVRHSALESRSARLKLPVQRKPFSGPALARGVSLLYRRNRTNGSWIVKASDGHGAYWTKAFAQADDFDDCNGKTVLTFYEAQDRAKQLVRGDGTAETAPITVDGALTKYRKDLEARGANAYNAEHPRIHLSNVLLAKPVALLTSDELKTWRDGLLGKVEPQTVNRVCKSLCAALELAAKADKRIQNRDAWKLGLSALPINKEIARNVVIPDGKVSEFVAEARARDPKLGLLVDVLAVTGARPSQVVRLRVADLLDHPTAPTLNMPKSAKGGGRNRSERKFERYHVPITPALAAKLKQAAAGRPADSRLLLRGNGLPWNDDPNKDYCEDVREMVKSIGLDPDVVTMYALRHSSIVRLLLKNVPIRLVVSLHNTSVPVIERHYSAHISRFGDEHLRKALLHHEEAAPVADNVIPLAS